MVTADEFGDPTGRELYLTVNGETRQKANTRDLIMVVPTPVEFASAFYTLLPGDVIYTGTSDGVGPIVPGDTVDATISGIGKLTVSVNG